MKEGKQQNVNEVVGVFDLPEIKVQHCGGWFNDVTLSQGKDTICLDVNEVPKLIQALQNILNNLP